MFERYTEKARRVIFFARYEASAYGSPYIESEYLLLGLFREDKALASRLSVGEAEEIRKEIDARTVRRERVSTSVDLPLNNESKRILAYAAEEAERANHKHIGTEHLLAGILREEGCFAAELLKKQRVTLEQARREIKSSHADAFGGFAGVHLDVSRHKPPTVEFVCGNEKLVSSTGFGPLPRIGESVELQGHAGVIKRYRVRDVSYRYEMPSEEQVKAADAAENVGGMQSRRHALIPEHITFQLEEQ